MKTDLAAKGIENRVLTFFALGGSGARAVEPLLHLCALGLGPRRLSIVIVDPDQSNAAVTRAHRLMEQYRRTREALGAGSSLPGYFRTELLDPVGRTMVWSPIADDQHLPDARFAARVERGAMGSQDLGPLFDLLFAERIREMDLGMGFRGVPAIGTVFMHRLRAERFFEQILTQAPQESEGVFFSVGSVFGGTGAAALPVIGRALTSVLRREGRPDIAGVDPRRVGAALLLPYFTLPPPPNGADPREVRPEAALFAQNAAAALPTYVSGQAGYGGIYVLGDDAPRQQAANEIGGEKQENAAHYIELYAALAALDFTSRAGERTDASLPVFRTTAVGGTNLGWRDLPLTAGSLRRLMGGVVAAHTFLTIFRPDGQPRPDLAGELAGATWLEILRLRRADLDRGAKALDLTGEYFRTLWRWLSELRGSTPALQIATTHGVAPSRLALHQTMEHMSGGKDRRSGGVSDPFQVFRHWNAEAHRRRPAAGLPGLLQVMQHGSEAFAEEWFGAPEAEV